jgi:manganese transport protein
VSPTSTRQLRHDIAGGSKFGFTLVWVIVASNLMAMLIQTLSAKARHRHRRNPAGGLPASSSRGRTSIGLWAAGRGDRDGDRPR